MKTTMTPIFRVSPLVYNHDTAGRITVPIRMEMNKIKIIWLKRNISQKPMATNMKISVAQTTRRNVHSYWGAIMRITSYPMGIENECAPCESQYPPAYPCSRIIVEAMGRICQYPAGSADECCIVSIIPHVLQILQAALIN